MGSEHLRRAAMGLLRPPGRLRSLLRGLERKPLGSAEQQQQPGALGPPRESPGGQVKSSPYPDPFPDRPPRGQGRGEPRPVRRPVPRFGPDGLLPRGARVQGRVEGAAPAGRGAPGFTRGRLPQPRGGKPPARRAPDRSPAAGRAGQRTHRVAPQRCPGAPAQQVPGPGADPASGGFRAPPEQLDEPALRDGGPEQRGALRQGDSGDHDDHDGRHGVGGGRGQHGHRGDHRRATGPCLCGGRLLRGRPEPVGAAGGGGGAGVHLGPLRDHHGHPPERRHDDATPAQRQQKRERRQPRGGAQRRESARRLGRHREQRCAGQALAR
mmetsp:Transcript_26106/g.58499  ORF Transcript_26106/g.58499 Transcript_26106/m.58499 type:complete len:324 (-) Transcript_26106:460-1431(-)